MIGLWQMASDSGIKAQPPRDAVCNPHGTPPSPSLQLDHVGPFQQPRTDSDSDFEKRHRSQGVILVTPSDQIDLG